LRAAGNRESRPRSISGWGPIENLIVRTAHATARHTGGSTFLLRPFSDHGFRGDQKPGDRRRILQRRPLNLGWVDNAFGDGKLMPVSKDQKPPDLSLFTSSLR
jgi:hypothetical protein